MESEDIFILFLNFPQFFRTAVVIGGKTTTEVWSGEPWRLGEGGVGGGEGEGPSLPRFEICSFVLLKLWEVGLRCVFSQKLTSSRSKIPVPGVAGRPQGWMGVGVGR